MNGEPSGNHGAVTLLLDRANHGDRAATEELLPLVYDELRQIAERHLAQERKDHTLQATALVHEAYLRLVGADGLGWQNRAHFFGAAAKAIRRILTDHARGRQRLKRGGKNAGRVPLENLELTVSGESEVDFVGLDAALEKLGTLDAQKLKVVELRFFAGLKVEEVAQALGVSESTVARDWRFARVWLHRELGGDEA